MFLNKESYSNCYFLSSFLRLSFTPFSLHTHSHTASMYIYFIVSIIREKPSSSISFGIFGLHWIRPFLAMAATVDMAAGPFFFRIFRTFLQFFETTKLIRKRNTKIKYKQTNASCKMAAQMELSPEKSERMKPKSDGTNECTRTASPTDVQIER